MVRAPRLSENRLLDQIGRWAHLQAFQGTLRRWRAALPPVMRIIRG